jgi:cytochrome c2
MSKLTFTSVVLATLVGMAVASSSAGGSAIAVSAQDAARAPGSETGEAAFSDERCTRCHSVEARSLEATTTSERMRGPDLSTIGETRDADWIVAFVKREETIDGTRHRTSYRGSDEDLSAIAAWLLELE